MSKVFPLLLIIVSLLLPNFAMAWGDPGHILIAAEAYRELSPEEKAQVFEVLKAHPDFARWAKVYHPNTNMDLPTYVFLRCSTWPDEIRGSGIQYDHPNWHFMDYPLRPPSFPFEPDPLPTNDVLFGVAQCEKILGDTNANPEARGAYLSYMVHLVGDMHQPLHCASYFTDAYPKGDRGGNDFYVKPADIGVRLHGIWDGLLGASVNRRAQWDYAVELQIKFPRASLPELTADTTPKSWSLEGRELAIQYGYLRGELKGSRNPDTAPALPADYIANAKVVAERQAAKAGYRLADEIHTYLKWSTDLPLLPPNTNNVAEMAIPDKISPADASKYYDETLVITGKVVAVSVTPGIDFLKFDEPATAPPFSALIFREHSGQFGDLQKLNGRTLEITGTVTDYHNKPEIILESTNQVKFIDDK
jgi:hypothetical protein